MASGSSALGLNQAVADQLHEIADLLEQQQANRYRVAAYRKAAATVGSLAEDVAELTEHGGVEALDALPSIGSGIARTIYEIVATGRNSRLETLRGSSTPEQLFQSVPGIGSELANRIHAMLAVDTLPALEMAAHDGRLERVPGVGPRRAAAIRAALASMLGRRRRLGLPPAQPPIAELLAVDRQYRQQAAANKLSTIAPKRFNPSGEPWLPILHVSRSGWHFTALFSNTARAHELGKTRDWVVIHYYHDHQHEDQCTVVTETRGALAGKRVVRGQELACRSYYNLS